MVQPLWKEFDVFSKTELLSGVAIPFPSIYQKSLQWGLFRYFVACVHSSVIHNNQNVEISHIREQMKK
jgi:hypothetical protein